MVTNISHSPEETGDLGKAWGSEAGPGWIFGLSGDLGAGKTRLIRGIAAGLEFTGRVHSPTFALLNSYEGGRVPITHLDLYRLSCREEILNAGLGEFLEQPTGVAVVEWFDRWCPIDQTPWIVPGIRLRRIVISSPSENVRHIAHEDFGA